MYEGSELSAPIDFRSELADILPRLRRFGLGLSGSMAAADEMAKDACEVAMGRAEELTGEDRFDSWMFAILHNVWRARCDLRERNGEPSETPDAFGQYAEFFGASGNNDRPLLDKLILSLPDKQRVVLMMVSVEGMSYRDTGEVLGLPIGEVMQQASLGRITLVANIAEAQETAS